MLNIIFYVELSVLPSLAYPLKTVVGYNATATAACCVEVLWGQFTALRDTRHKLNLMWVNFLFAEK